MDLYAVVLHSPACDEHPTSSIETLSFTVHHHTHQVEVWIPLPRLYNLTISSSTSSYHTNIHLHLQAHTNSNSNSNFDATSTHPIEPTKLTKTHEHRNTMCTHFHIKYGCGHQSITVHPHPGHIQGQPCNNIQHVDIGRNAGCDTQFCNWVAPTID
jgi:hypothetical protein